MLRWLENFVIRRIIKRAKAELPEMKQHAIEQLLLKKDYVVEEIKKAIKEKVRELAEKVEEL